MKPRRTREGIEKTAVKLREASARGGRPVTQEQARQRVIQGIRNVEKKNAK